MSSDKQTDDGFDFDYELEPVDEHVTQVAQQRVEEEVLEAEKKIDIDAVYRDMHRHEDIDFDWEKLRPRFSIKALLILTAVIACLMAAWQIGFFNQSTFTALLALTLLTLSSLYTWIEFYEERRKKTVAEIHSRRRARLEGEDLPEEEDPVEPKGLVEELISTITQKPQFGIRDLMIATAGVALLLWLVLQVGPTRAALLMGFVAVVGVIAEASGANPPLAMRMVWWLSVVGYCMITFGRALLDALGFA